MEGFILKLTRCFNDVSVSDFLSSLICSMLNYCNVFRHPAKTEALRICCGGLWITGAVTKYKRNAAAVSGSSHVD